MTLSILNAPGSSLPKIGASPFSMIPRPNFSQECAMLDAIGATMVRIEVPWSETEQVKGVYALPDWVEGRIAAAREAKRAVVLLLDYSNPLYTGGVFVPPTTSDQIAAFCNYAAFVASQYVGPDVTFEIWNEPNNPQFWNGAPNSAQYAALLNAVAPAIRAKQSSAQIITAGVGDLAAPGINAAPYMQAVVAASPSLALAAHTLHPYNPGTPETIFPYIAAYRAATAWAGPLWVTEWGYCAPWLSGGEVMRAIYSARMIGCAILAGLNGLAFYNLRDTGTDQTNIENTFGLFNYAMQPKGTTGAVYAVKAMMDALAGTVSYDAEKLSNGVYRITLRKDDGTVTKIVWTDGPAITHCEPMQSITDVRDVRGGASGFHFTAGAGVSIALSNDWPVQIIKGTA